MPSTAPTVIRLADYRPPEFLIDAVALSFRLAAAETQVAATLELRRNPAATRGDGSLRLDGEGLALDGIALDGRDLAPHEYAVDDEALTLFQVPDRFRLETRVRIHPDQNTALEGLYLSNGMLCTQCEAAGLSPHHLFPGPPRCHGPLRRHPGGGPGRCIRSCSPTATQPGPRTCRMAATGPAGMIPSPSPAICSP